MIWKIEEEDIREIIDSGESSKVEFKEDGVHNDRLAMEIAAFANFKGGVILLGVSDDGQIRGLARQDNEERVMNICSTSIEPRIIPEYEQVQVAGKKIAVITVDPGREKPYAVLKQGRRHYYIRVGSTVRESTQRELMRMFQDSALLHCETLPTAAELSDLELSTVYDFFINFRNINLDQMEKDELERILINSSIMEEGKRLTIAGCLLFARTPSRFFAGAGISFASIDGNDSGDPIKEIKHFDGPVLDSIEKILSLLNVYNRSKIVGFAQNGQRLEQYEYPAGVLREIVVNAFIHRDYCIEGSQIRCFWYKDFFEVRSPGVLPNFLNIEKMKMGVTYYRNPVLMSYFYDRGFIERLGRGIRMVFAKMHKHNGTEPIIEEQGGEVVVKILKKHLR